MQIALLVIASLLPVALLLWFFERQDRGRKEPLRLKWKVFKYGLMITLLAGVVEIQIDNLFLNFVADNLIYVALTSFVTAALIEESLKLWVVKKFIYKDKHFDEIMDGIYYTIIVSLGFAAFENLLYVLQGGFAIAFIRAILSVPAHAMFSGIMGYYIGLAKFSHVRGVSTGGHLILKGFGYAVLYHGLFNFFLLSETILVFLVIPLLVIMGFHLKFCIKQAHYKDHVDKIKPERFTFYIAAKIFFGTLLILLGIIGIVGSILLSQEPESGYSQNEIYSSIGFAIFLGFLGYLLIRNKKKK